MKIHEFQGKELFKKFDLPVPKGILCKTAKEVFAAAKQLEGTVVVKSQIHAGGRGKGKIFNKTNLQEVVLDGGVKVTKSPEEAKDIASKILGNILVTHQTGPQGKEVKNILVEKGCDIKKEYYVGLVLDRSNAKVTLMASTEGGMDIEEVAKNTPEKILKMTFDPVAGFKEEEGSKIASALGFDNNLSNQFTKFCASLYQMYIQTDASIVEINPLVTTNAGELVALDAKVNFEDNALFRHKELLDLRDHDEEDPLEIEASKHGLSYIALDGSIGCMVNGAGLAMATMDIIKLYGSEPANFLDVGGGATKENVTAALKIILSDPKVKAILVNIFGGIMKCDVIAEGVIAAAKEIGLTLPLVVRLQGTNVEIGKKLLAESGLSIIAADTMADAAEKAVKAVG